MLTETRETLTIELRGCDGGLSVLPSPPTVPKAHRFQGGLIRSNMLELAGRVLTPERFSGRAMRIWLCELKSWHFPKHQRPEIGDLYDRTGELPGGGLEAMIYVPEDAWLTCRYCLGTTWRRLAIAGVDGDGRRMTVVDFSFSSGVATAS